MSPRDALTYALPRTEIHETGASVSTTVTLQGKRYEVWYRTSQGPVSDGVETFLAACLVPAMRVGCPIRTPAPISRELLHGMEQVQTVLHGWFPKLQRIPIQTEVLVSPRPRASGVGSFFSGGVDACYTFLKHATEITNTILIHGFDYQADKTVSRSTVSRNAQEAMTKLGKPLIEVDTNIRSFGDHFADWGTEYHGSVLASVALLLSPQLRTVYIPSSYTYDTLFPWGSHPELDHLWSTEQLQVVHDGCDISRSQKVGFIASNPAVLGVLRVCWSDHKRADLAYNCGSCEKCTRTMLDLRLAGALERCAGFRRQLKLKKVARLDLRHSKARYFYEGSYREALRRGTDAELIAALEECLSNRHHIGIRGALLHLRRGINQKIIRRCMRPMERAARWLTRI